MEIKKIGLSGMGIPREIMPQIPNDKLDDFLSSLSCETKLKLVEIQTISPTQDTYLEEKVLSKKKYFEDNQDDYFLKTLIVSQAGFLLDGHHNFLGLMLVDKTALVKIRVVAMSMAELLVRATLYEHSYVQSYEELFTTVQKENLSGR